MCKKGLLVIVCIGILVLSGCGKEQTTTEVKEVVVEQVSEVEKEVDVKETDLPNGEYSDMGEGTVYLVNASGTTEDGNVIVQFVEADTILTQIGLNAEDFNGANLAYIYVDGYLLTKEQMANSQKTITLEGDNLKFGVHKVEIVQYENDDATAAMITYKTCSYEIKEK